MNGGALVVMATLEPERNITTCAKTRVVTCGGNAGAIGNTLATLSFAKAGSDVPTCITKYHYGILYI